MDKIITKIYTLIKETDDLITLEESIKHLMNSTFTELVSDTFTQLNQPVKEKAQREKHSVVRDDPRMIHFSFCAVTYHRTLFKNKCLNTSIYPLGKMVKRVGQAQAEADKRLVDKLDLADHLPEGEKVDFLYAEADGLCVEQRKKSIIKSITGLVMRAGLRMESVCHL